MKPERWIGNEIIEAPVNARACPDCGGKPGVASFPPEGRAHGGTTISGCNLSAFSRYKRDAVALWNRKVVRSLKSPAPRKARSKP